MKTMGFLAFEKDQIPDFLDTFGWTLQNGRLLQEKKPLVCECCGEDVTVDNLGSVMPGSLEVYCDNPACFAKYVEGRITQE